MQIQRIFARKHVLFENAPNARAHENAIFRRAGANKHISPSRAPTGASEENFGLFSTKTWKIIEFSPENVRILKARQTHLLTKWWFAACAEVRVFISDSRAPIGASGEKSEFWASKHPNSMNISSKMCSFWKCAKRTGSRTGDFWRVLGPRNK